MKTSLAEAFAKNDEKVSRFCNHFYTKCKGYLLQGQEVWAEWREETKREAASELYQIKANYPTGYISERALWRLQNDDKYKRKNLTHEHYYSRTQISLELISVIDNNPLLSPEVVLPQLQSITKRGLLTHYVSTEENSRLPDIVKKNPDWTWQQHYEAADIVLVRDPGVPTYKYRYQGVTYESQPDLADALNISKSTVGKWCTKGIIEKIECAPQKSLLDFGKTESDFLQTITFQSTSPMKTEPTLLMSFRRSSTKS